MEAMLVYLESLPPGVWIGLWSFSAASLFRRVQFHSIHYAIFFGPEREHPRNRRVQGS